MTSVYCSDRANVMCQVSHNNLRASRNFNAHTSCRSDEFGTPWYITDRGDICFHTLDDVGDIYESMSKCHALSASNTAFNTGGKLSRDIVLSRRGGQIHQVGYISVYYEGGPTNGRFKWISSVDQSNNVITGDDVSARVMHWKDGEPKRPHERRCVKVDSVGEWETADCSEPLRATCQKHALQHTKRSPTNFGALLAAARGGRLVAAHGGLIFVVCFALLYNELFI